MSKATEDDFVDSYLPALLGQAWHLSSTQFHQEVEKAGLSVLEWRVLSALAGRKSITISRLAQITVSKQPTVTRLLARMEDQGFIARKRAGEDRRHIEICITDRGRSVIAQLNVLAREHEALILNVLGGEDTLKLKAILRNIILKFSPQP